MFCIQKRCKNSSLYSADNHGLCISRDTASYNIAELKTVVVCAVHYKERITVEYMNSRKTLNNKHFTCILVDGKSPHATQ